MAIDDNTSYELTGYQVKDLAGRIRLKADASAIPTVNDATLTIVQNGATVGTFTANQSTNTTVNLAGGVYADDPTSPATPAPWVTSSDIDWSTIKHSAPTATILENIGTVASNRSYTASANGFLVGKGVTLANGGKAGVFLTDSDDLCLGGIPYSDYSGNIQVAFCVPVYKGQTVYFRMSGGSSRVEVVRLVASHSEASI